MTMRVIELKKAEEEKLLKELKRVGDFRKRCFADDCLKRGYKDENLNKLQGHLNGLGEAMALIAGFDEAKKHWDFKD